MADAAASALTTSIVKAHERPAVPAAARRAVVAWLLVVLYAAGIFYFSSLSQPPAPPGALTDKHVHALVFGGLAATLIWALAGARWSAVTTTTGVWAVVLTSLYGAADEWHQSFVPNRQSDVLDWLADSIGGVLVAVAVVAGARWLRDRGWIDRIDRSATRAEP